MFADIPGQERAKVYFAGALAGGPGHAYLLAGPEGLGKRRFALELGAAWWPPAAAAASAPSANGSPAGRIPISSSSSVRASSSSSSRSRALIADLSLKPFSSTHRVWVIIEPERLNTEAANTFLKSLEEPPSHVHFILVSDAPERVLPTIVSRCQVVEFQTVGDDELVAHLVAKEGLDVARAAVVARLSHGSLERALRLADDDRGPQRRQRYLHLAAGIVLHDRDAERAFVDEVGNAEAAAAGDVEADIARRRDELERTVPTSANVSCTPAGSTPCSAASRRASRVWRRSTRSITCRASCATSGRSGSARPAPSPTATVWPSSSTPPSPGPTSTPGCSTVVGRTRQDSVPEHRPQARPAGDVCPLPGGLGKCLRIVSVVFGDGGKVYHFDPGSLELAVGDQVVVETARGTDFGRVVEASASCPKARRAGPAAGHAGRRPGRPRAGRRQPRARVRGDAAGPRARRQGRASR